jgi:hypothetical protein
MKATTVKRIFEELDKRSNNYENGLHMKIEGDGIESEFLICGDTSWKVDIKDKLLYLESITETYFIDTDSITRIKTGG